MMKVLSVILTLFLLIPATSYAAIAHDSNAGLGTAVSSLTGTFTFTNTAGTLCTITIDASSNATTVTKMTMTKGAADVEMATGTPMFTAFASIWIQQFYMVTPDTGSITVKWTLSTTNEPNIGADCVTGAATTNVIGAYQQGSANPVATQNMTTTTLATNSWLIGGLYTNTNVSASMAVSGTGQTLRVNTGNATNATGIGVSEQTTTALASYTSTFSWTGNTAIVYSMMELEAAAVVAATPSNYGTIILFQ